MSTLLHIWVYQETRHLVVERTSYPTVQPSRNGDQQREIVRCNNSEHPIIKDIDWQSIPPVSLLLTPTAQRHSGGVCVQWAFFRRSVYFSQNPFLVLASAEVNWRRHLSERKYWVPLSSLELNWTWRGSKVLPHTGSTAVSGYVWF